MAKSSKSSPKQSNKSKSSSGAKKPGGKGGNYFKDNFGPKKTVRELRGGTAKEDKAFRKNKPDEEGKNKIKPNKTEEKSFDKKASFPKPKNKTFTQEDFETESENAQAENNKDMPLNKYLAHCGISSRREAATLIKEGKVKVNGQVLTEPGYKVQEKDKVEYASQIMKVVKNLVYILLNKPKDFVTTTKDPHGRKTVLDLVSSADVPRLYPVGRLDRNTTGLLLITNDGDLAQKLSHPKYDIKKVYQVTLNKDFSSEDFEKVEKGLHLEDGPVKVDKLFYLNTQNELGIEIHS